MGDDKLGRFSTSPWQRRSLYLSCGHEFTANGFFFSVFLFFRWINYSFIMYSMDSFPLPNLSLQSHSVTFEAFYDPLRVRFMKDVQYCNFVELNVWQRIERERQRWRGSISRQPVTITTSSCLVSLSLQEVIKCYYCTLISMALVAWWWWSSSSSSSWWRSENRKFAILWGFWTQLNTIRYPR